MEVEDGFQPVRGRRKGRLKRDPLPPGTGATAASSQASRGPNQPAPGRVWDHHRGQGGGLPDGIRRKLNRRRKVPNSVSLSFDKFIEIPSSRDVGSWLVNKGLGVDVKRVHRSEFDKRFYLQFDKEEEGVKFMEEVGEQGKEWKDEETGEVVMIKARQEGEQWIPVTISNIDPDTPRQEIEDHFKPMGEVKDLEFAKVGNIELDEVNLKVKLKEEVIMPAFLVVRGVPGDDLAVDRWELDYPGKPMVCYRCYNSGHRKRDCRNPTVPLEALLSRTDFTEGGVKDSYAQVVRSQAAAEAEKHRKKEEEDKQNQEQIKIDQEKQDQTNKEKEIQDHKKRREQVEKKWGEMKKNQEELKKREGTIDNLKNELDQIGAELTEKEEELRAYRRSLDERKLLLEKGSRELTDWEGELNRNERKQEVRGRREDREDKDRRKDPASARSRSSHKPKDGFSC